MVNRKRRAYLNKKRWLRRKELRKAARLAREQAAVCEFLNVPENHSESDVFSCGSPSSPITFSHPDPIHIIPDIPIISPPSNVIPKIICSIPIEIFNAYIAKKNSAPVINTETRCSTPNPSTLLPVSEISPIHSPSQSSTIVSPTSSSNFSSSTQYTFNPNLFVPYVETSYSFTSSSSSEISDSSIPDYEENFIPICSTPKTHSRLVDPVRELTKFYSDVSSEEEEEEDEETEEEEEEEEEEEVEILYFPREQPSQGAPEIRIPTRPKLIVPPAADPIAEKEGTGIKIPSRVPSIINFVPSEREPDPAAILIEPIDPPVREQQRRTQSLAALRRR